MRQVNTWKFSARNRKESFHSTIAICPAIVKCGWMLKPLSFVRSTGVVQYVTGCSLHQKIPYLNILLRLKGRLFRRDASLIVTRQSIR